MPEDFVKIVKNMPCVSYNKLTARWRVGRRTLDKWLRDTEMEDYIANPPPPPDWAELAPTMLSNKLAWHYGVGRIVIKRWVDATGIRTLPKQKLKLSTDQVKKIHAVRYCAPEEVSAAADYLRMFYSNVHRCDIYLDQWRTWGQEQGLPNKGAGQYYVEGLGVMTNEQLLTLARDHGYGDSL
jgi:hypothetical protein